MLEILQRLWTIGITEAVSEASNWPLILDFLQAIVAILNIVMVVVFGYVTYRLTKNQNAITIRQTEGVPPVLRYYPIKMSKLDDGELDKHVKLTLYNPRTYPIQLQSFAVQIDGVKTSIVGEGERQHQDDWAFLITNEPIDSNSYLERSFWIKCEDFDWDEPYQIRFKAIYFDPRQEMRCEAHHPSIKSKGKSFVRFPYDTPLISP